MKEKNEKEDVHLFKYYTFVQENYISGFLILFSGQIYKFFSVKPLTWGNIKGFRGQIQYHNQGVHKKILHIQFAINIAVNVSLIARIYRTLAHSVTNANFY